MKLIDLQGTLINNTIIKIVDSELNTLFIGKFHDIFNNTEMMYSTIHFMWLNTYENKNIVIELEN